MSKKNKDQEKIIMQHVVEVRLKKRMFKFFDMRGRFVDFMIDKLDTDQIKLRNDGTRFELADEDLTRLFFFSFENFGFQTEARSSFTDFKNEVDIFLNSISDYGDYNWADGLVRIGTKSTILYHRRFDDFDKIKNSYKNLLIRNDSKLAELTGSQIVDSTHTFDFKLDKSKANVLTGPMTKQEAMARFLGNTVYESSFKKENGLLLSIDVSGNSPEEVADIEELRTRIKSQIDDIENLFNGFKALFDQEEK